MTPSRSRISRWTFTPWRALLGLAVVVLVVTPNLWLAARSIGLVLKGAPAVDWQQYVEASHRFWAGGDLFAVTATYGYHYSPFLAPLFGVVAPLGVVGWRLLHLAAAAALPTWSMRIIALASWPLWFDVETGNIVVFVVLAAAWALRGGRLMAGVYLLLLILIPRPLMLPVAAWLLWKDPRLRMPFVIGVVAHGLAVVAGGWAGDWIHALLAASADVGNWSNVGPSRFIGQWWLLIGIPLAAWLTVRGRVGWAALAASPYWLPYYLLMPLLELARRRPIKEEPGHGKQDEPLATVLGQRDRHAEGHQPGSI
jgi:hypothetical protein